MRLAYLSTDPGIAYGGSKGASVHLAEMTAALAGSGSEVLLVVSAVQPDTPDPPRGMTVETLPGPAKTATAAERLAAEPFRQSWLERRFAAFGAEAVYERLALHTSAGAAAAHRLGVPHLVEINAPLLEEAAAFRHLDHAGTADRLEQSTLVAADVVIAVSRPLAAYASARGARRVVVMPNAISVKRYGRAPEAHVPPVAVFCGALRPWHGIETIAAAWDILGPAAPTLLVVGDGPGRQALEAVGAEVTGFVAHERVPALLGRADIGLAPYAPDCPRYFSPLKLFDYLAAGLAVVAADLPGVSDIVGPGSAVLIDPGDAPALADAVARLVVDHDRRLNLGRAGQALVMANHTWERRAGEVRGLVREMRIQPAWS